MLLFSIKEKLIWANSTRNMGGPVCDIRGSLLLSLTHSWKNKIIKFKITLLYTSIILHNILHHLLLANTLLSLLSSILAKLSLLRDDGGGGAAAVVMVAVTFTIITNAESEIINWKTFLFPWHGGHFYPSSLPPPTLWDLWCVCYGVCMCACLAVCVSVLAIVCLYSCSVYFLCVRLHVCTVFVYVCVCLIIITLRTFPTIYEVHIT